MAKMIQVGVNRNSLTAASINAAAEALYDEIQGGLVIKPIRLAWEVFSRAKTLKGTVEAKERDEIAALKTELEFYKLPWWRRIGRRTI
jgi:hypothetical protein